MKRKMKFSAAAAAVVLGLSLTACTSKQAAKKVGTATPSASAVATVIPADKTDGPDIGKKTKDKLCQKLYVTNCTGKNITGFAVKVDGDKNYSDNMMQANDVFKANENRDVYYTEDSEDVTAQSTASSSLSGALLNVSYDLQLTFEDGSQEQLKDFPIGNADEVALTAASVDDGGFVYLTYTDINGEKVSTFDTEKAEYDAAKKAAEDAAAAQQAAEEAAAAAAAQQAQAQQNTTQSYSGSSSQQTQTYSAPSGGDTSTSSGSSGSADSGCLTGDGNSPLLN